MSWVLEFRKSAERDLAVLDHPLRRRIIEKLGWLIENFDSIVPLPLGGRWRGLFKLRVGDWRVAYEINFSKKLITVHYIDRRDRIYKIK